MHFGRTYTCRAGHARTYALKHMLTLRVWVDRNVHRAQGGGRARAC